MITANNYTTRPKTRATYMNRSHAQLRGIRRPHTVMLSPSTFVTAVTRSA